MRTSSTRSCRSHGLEPNEDHIGVFNRPSAIIDPKHPAHAYYLERDARSFAALRPLVEREFEDPDRVFMLLRSVFRRAAIPPAP